MKTFTNGYCGRQYVSTRTPQLRSAFRFSSLFVSVFLLMNLLFVGTVSAQILQRGTSVTATSTGNSISINKPTGVVAGDVLFANIVQNETSNAALSNATLSGWTVISGVQIYDDGNTGSSNSWWGTLLYRVADGTEPSSFTFSLDADCDMAIGNVIAFSGVDVTGGVKSDGTAGGPFDVTPGSLNITNANTATAIGITTATANAAVIMFGQVANNDTYSSWNTSSPGSLAELYDQNTTLVDDASIGAAWATKATAGATGNGTVNISATDRNAAILIALRRCVIPATPGTITQPTNKCAGSTGNTFSISAVSGATTYTWSVTGTGWAITGGQGTTSATITIGTAAGTVSVTAGNACGTSSASTTGSITPTAYPAAPGSITQPTNMCAGSTGNIFSIASVSGATTYTWSVTGTGWAITAGQGTTSATITIGSGVGTVSVSAMNACGTSRSNSVSTTGDITPTATPSIPGTITQPTNICAGSTGNIFSISAVSGATTYTWTVIGSGWSVTAGQGTTSATITAGSGTAIISVTAGNACGYSLPSLTNLITPSTIPSSPASISGSTSVCAGSTGNTYSVAAVSGATTYTWTVPTGWSITGGQGTNSITVTAGSFGQNGNISVVASNGCGSSSARNLSVSTVANPTTANAGPDQTGSATCGVSTVTLAANNPTVGTGSWSIISGTGGSLANANSPTSSFSGVAGNSYTLRWTISNSICTPSTDDVVISFGSSITISSVTKKSYNGADISCYGAADAQITVTATGGTGTLQYSKDNGSTYQSSNIFTGLAAGTYQIKVKDANNCSSSASSVTITSPTQVQIVSIVKRSYNGSDLSSPTANNGEITITASGGTPPYTYSHDNGVTYEPNNVLGGLAAGTYQVKVKDANGCVSAASTVTIVAPQHIVITSVVKKSYNGSDLSCANAADGQITVTATGGSGTLTYSKNNGVTYQSSNVFTSLAAGTYNIIVKDANADVSTVSVVTITAPAALSASYTSGTILCNAGSATVNISASGGTAPYSGTGSFTQHAGTVSYTVTDANGCTSSVSVTLTEPAGMSVSASASGVACANATTTLTTTASGGNPPYQYSLNGSSYQSSPDFTVGVGTYTVTVKDANNCTKASNTVTVTASDAIAPVITCSGNITVNNDAGKCYATVDLTGHATATDNCAVSSITYLPAGPYNVGTTTVTARATDGSGNSSTCTFTITVNDTEKPVITCPVTVKVNNDNGSCYATGVNLGTPSSRDNCGVASVTNNAPDQFPIGNTTVTWTVTDVHGNTNTCEQTVTVSDAELPVITCPSNTTVAASDSCNYSVEDFAATAVATDNCPGVTVTQSPLAGTILPLGDHTVTLTARDNAGNTSTCSFTITVADQTAPLMVNPGDQTGLADSTNCNYVVPDLTGLVTATDNCSSSVTLTQSIQVGSVYNAGTYPVTITATDEAGNSSTITFNLIVLPASPPNTGPMSGPQDVCPYTGTGIPVTYSVEDTKFATSYTWSATAGITIVSGQGTRVVQVLFDASYTRGSITVYASSPCGAGPIRNYTVGRQIPNTLGAIYGPSGACPYIGSTVNYWVNKVRYATGYNWQVPAGASIVAHPGGAGENDTVITVAFTNAFTSGDITVNTLSNCYTGLPKKLPVTLQAPATPGPITGPTNACPLIGTNQTAIYMIRSVKNATSYTWTVPTGASIVSGQGDTTIAVSYDNTFTSGTISVIASANCGSSTARTLSIKRSLPATPGAISGLKDVCPLVGTDQTTVYSIKPAKDANSYLWTVPTGATIVSGQGDTAIVVSFGQNLVAGNISVVSVNNCAQSAARTLAITRKIPATPSAISGSTDACATIGTATNVKYSIKKVAGASSYEWAVPAGATLVSGQGDTAIFVNYTTAFTTGAITVASVSNCGTSAVRSLTIKKNAPVIPGVITETAPVCPSRTATYSIAPCANAIAYDWIVPAGSTVVGDRNGTTITVVYPNDSVNGSVSVRSRNNCSASALKTLKVAYSACTAARVVTTPVSGSGITVNNDPNAQVDSVKSNLVNDGFVLINQTSVYMDNQKELPVFKYLDEGNEYRYVFVADKSVTMSEISFRNPDDKEIYNFRRYTGSDGNTSVFNYTPNFSGNYVVRVKQFGSGDKPRLEGHILIFRRKR